MGLWIKMNQSDQQPNVEYLEILLEVREWGGDETWLGRCCKRKIRIYWISEKSLYVVEQTMFNIEVWSQYTTNCDIHHFRQSQYFIQNHWPPAPPWLWSSGSVPRWIITCLNWTVVNHFKCESWENKGLKNPETVLEGRTLHYPCPLRSESNDIPTGDYLGNVNWFKLFRHSVSKLRELCQFLN